MSQNIGVIDLGSNSIRLILMQVAANGAYKLMDEIKESARIGENMGLEMVIKPAAVRRTIETIKLFGKFCNANDVGTIYGVATAALRKATNSNEILEIIMQETGVSFRILSEEEEAYYDYLGVVNSLSFDNALIMDIGGGSTELILCRQRQLIHWTSLPFGAITLTENYLPTGRAEPGQLENLEHFLRSKFKLIPWLADASGYEVLGVGGTMRNLGRIDRKNTRYSLGLLHNYQVPANRVDEIYLKLQNSSVEGRKAIPGLSKERADIILGGIAAIKSLLDYIKAPGIRISGCGLREGVFYEHLFRNRPLPVLDNVTEHSMENMINLYSVRKSHGEQVAKICLSLFDQLQSLHGYGLWERKLLYIAAMLHDVGSVLSFYNHHKHSMYVILNRGINGLSHRELLLVALIAASHGKIDFKIKLRQYVDVLQPLDGMLIRRLGVLLRMGENLDRSEAGVVEEVVCEIKENEVEIACLGPANADLEIRELYKKVTNFSKVFGKKFKFLGRKPDEATNA